MTRAALYNQHVHIADRIANGFYFPGADQEDVIQEARVALWIATGTHDQTRGGFPSYASHVVRTHLIDMLRIATREKNRVLTNADRSEQLELVADTDNTENTVENREQLRVLLARREEMVQAAQRRQRWAETKRRQRAA